MSESLRPSPDAMLLRLKSEEERARAKLKIFFGFAPGVGKTYAMLESAQRLRTQGIDVVVGCVETHGRQETAALAEGLERIPEARVEYRGRTLLDFDLVAALARRPAVLLLDELAHTNAPGLRHAKRHQDVLELLEAGIEVHTTLNVQHVESLNDVVAQVTQIRVRETVPDALLDRADEIELIDLPPDELLRRLAEGRVYRGEAADRASQNFFSRGNLLALRELALRRVADRVDADVQAYREAHEIQRTWAAAERIMVCVSPSPAAARLIRAAKRMAVGLRASWVAAYVEPQAMSPLSQADVARLDEHMRLAESLGGEAVRLVGAPASRALLNYAIRENVTRMIVGKPTHPRLRDLLRGSMLDELVRGSGDIDVHVISGDGTEAAPSPPERPPVPVEPSGFLWAIFAIGVATAACFLLQRVLALPDLVMLYLVMIMIVATRFGRWPSFFAAALSVAAYDFFFVPPYFTFAVSDTRHVLTFLTMFGVGIALSSLTLRLRRQELGARDREARTAALYALSRALGSALDDAQAARVLTEVASTHFAAGVSVERLGSSGEIELVARSGAVTGEAAQAGLVRWVLEHGRAAGLGTDTIPGARALSLPMRSGSRIFGVLTVEPRSGKAPTREERDFLEAFARQGSLAIERAQLADEAKAAALKARTEEMRSSLLSAVSHDLRTPLAAITGAATALADSTAALSPPVRADMLSTICEEAERLERLVGNLLDMTRLEANALVLKRAWVPIDELIGSAINRLEERLEGRPILTSLDPALPLVSVDPVLIEQVFVNLLENAGKYTPAGSPLEIEARPGGAGVALAFLDRGPGIPRGAEERIFEKFYRGPHVGVGGVGLGLAICRGIVAAHDGTIRAENRPGGGAIFTVELPVGGQPPSTERA